RAAAPGGPGPVPLPRAAAGLGGLRRDGPGHRRGRPWPAERGSPLAGGGGPPRPGTSRLRASWLTDCAERLGLATFMAAAGISCSQRPGDLVARLDAADEA